MKMRLKQISGVLRFRKREQKSDLKTNAHRLGSAKRAGGVIMVCACLSLRAQTVFWGASGGGGGNGNWTDAGWYSTYNGGSTGSYSTAADRPGEGADVIIGQTANASTVTINSNVGTINSLFLTHNNNAPRKHGNLVIESHGFLNIAGTLQTHNSNSGATSHITVNGGSLTVGGLATLGMRHPAGFSFVQNGGATGFNGGLRLNDTDVDTVVYEMKGGSMTAADLTFGRTNSGTTKRTAEAARLEISGGAVSISGAVRDAFASTPRHFPGTYRVIGSGATAISIGSMTLDAENDPGDGGPSVISFLLDENGVTRTQVSGAAVFTDTVLQIGLKTGYDGGDLAGGMTFDLLTAASISASGMTVDDLGLPGGLRADWAIVNGGNGQILQLTIAEGPDTRNAFIDQIFDFQVTRNITYGHGDVGYPTKTGTKTLQLDLFQPTGEGAPTRRPALICIHGGGFQNGARTDNQIQAICRAYARRGYVAVSITYRLQGDNPSAEPGVYSNFLLLLRTINAAVQDAAKAVRWLRSNADTYGIDPDRIAILGGSAGATTAMVTGYQEASVIGPNAGVRAIVNFWGGMYGAENLVDPNDPPLFIVHGTADSTVPFSAAQSMERRCNLQGVPCELYPLQDAEHSAWIRYWNDVVDGKTIDRRCAEFLFRHLDLLPLHPASNTRLEALPFDETKRSLPLRFRSYTGFSYGMDSSADLKTWEAWAAPELLPGTGAAIILEPSAPQSLQRFFRIRVSSDF